jgi:hypothetical protein
MSNITWTQSFGNYRSKMMMTMAWIKMGHDIRGGWSDGGMKWNDRGKRKVTEMRKEWNILHIYVQKW